VQGNREIGRERYVEPMRLCLVTSLLAVVAACAAPPVPVTPAVTETSKAPSPTAATHDVNRVETTTAAPPGFTDRDRKVKIVAAVPKLESHFAAYAERSEVPGLAVGLVVDGALVWAKGYGVRDLTARTPVDPDTLFRIASMTKAFTATAVLELRDAGEALARRARRSGAARDAGHRLSDTRRAAYHAPRSLDSPCWPTAR
jgi:CubicO group peptidase (beta-lactamase class C family)